jgi:TetR/AcrR family transcriptional regulator, repressor for uid operon
MTSKMEPNDAARAGARRAQVLAAAADVFARTAITPEALAELARMSKEQIIEELIARNMEQTFTVLRQAEAAPGPLLESLIDALPAGVEQNLAPEPGAVQLELMAEAVRNSKVAEALRAADALARRRVSDLLTGPRGTLRGSDAAQLESRIEILFALFEGIRIRALMNPALKRDALIATVRPVVRMVLTPGN